MTILCPIDFSTHSLIALEYSMNLASILDAEVHIVNVFEVIERPASTFSMSEIVGKGREESMNKVLSGIGVLMHSEMLPRTRILEGPTVYSILQYVNQNAIDLIVMGSQGSNSMTKRLFGNTTYTLLKRTKTPVMVIPYKEEKYLEPKKLVLALDRKPLNNRELLNLPHLISKKLSLKLDILHIGNEGEENEITRNTIETSGLNVGKFVLKCGKNIPEIINSFMQNFGQSILIMIRRPKGFLENLVFKGNTSTELKITDTPLLIIPE